MRKAFFPIAFAAVFATGTAGLIYQVAWQRYLSRLMGSDSIATAIILAAFLGGLSLGFRICGKLTLRFQRPLFVYGVLEGLIGIWCLLFPFIFKGVEMLVEGWRFSPPFWIVPQGLVCAAILVGFPTICMGGTIPFLTRSFSKNLEESTRVHAWIYAVNTFGAFVGALLAGFYLIPEYGLPGTLIRAAFLNLGTCGFFLLFYSVRVVLPKTVVDAAVPPPEPDEKRLPTAVLSTIAFLSGFYVMTLENVLIRIVNLCLGSSSYSFSIIVSVFILAIAIGSFAVGYLKNISGRTLFYNQAGIAFLLMLIFLTLDRWPYGAHLIRIAFQANKSGFWGYYALTYFALTALLIFPVSLMGATVPILFHELKRDLLLVGRYSGNLLSWNTGGNLTGSLLGGILFYLFLDNAGVYGVAAVLAGISAVLAGLRLSRRYVLGAAMLVTAATVFAFVPGIIDTSHFVVGTFRLQSPLPFSYDGSDSFFDALNSGQTVEFYDDGPTATVAVTRDRVPIPVSGEKSMALMINGKSDSSTLGDIYTVRLLAHIPALLAPQRKSVMVVGLGTGVTAGELTLYPDIERIDVAEISPAVVRALPLFSRFTHNLQKDPRFTVHVGDAFRIIGRSSQKWDIIISEPSNPWVTGVDSLFTRDFYRLVKSHLSDNGMLMQWVHTISSSPEMLGMILRTVHEEFPNTRIFIAGSDLLILGSERAIACDDLLRAQVEIENNEKVRQSLAQMNMDSLAAILVRERWTPSFVAEFFGKFDIQTLDFPKLHYIAGRNFFMGKDLALSHFLDNRTTRFGGEYLFYQQCENWQIATESRQAFDSLVKSTRSIYDGKPTPITHSLLLRAYLSDSEQYPLSWEKQKQYGIDVLQFVVADTPDEQEWKWIKLENASFRAKAEVLLAHVQAFRNWMTPYPLVGLFQLLGRGMAQGADAEEKNWCRLQLAHLLVNEGAKQTEVQDLLKNLLWDASGKIILSPADRPLIDGLDGYLSGSNY